MASFRKRDLEFQQTDTIGFVEHRTKDGQQSHFHSFCGDSLPTTDLQVSKLFHAHQPPKRRKIEISGENNKLIDLYNCREESILESEHKQLPSMELLQLIKEVAASKLGRQNTAGTAIHSLEKRFSSSALVALGVVIEEITKETIHSWYSRGVPLPYNAKNVLKETLAQLGGSPLSHSFTDEIVMNRLNALFAGRAKANKQQVLQLSAFLKRGGAQLPKCDETFGKLSSFHEGSTLNESNASSKVLDTFSVNSVPNFLPMYSRLPPNVRDEEKGHEKYPAYLQESFHAGTQ